MGAVNDFSYSSFSEEKLPVAYGNIAAIFSLLAFKMVVYRMKFTAKSSNIFDALHPFLLPQALLV